MVIDVRLAVISSGQQHNYTCTCYILLNHHERTQILGSNWIFDNVSEKYREK